MRHISRSSGSPMHPQIAVAVFVVGRPVGTGHLADVLPAQAVVVADVETDGVAVIGAAHNTQHAVVELDVAEVHAEKPAVGRPRWPLDQRGVALPSAATVPAA